MGTEGISLGAVPRDGHHIVLVWGFPAQWDAATPTFCGSAPHIFAPLENLSLRPEIHPSSASLLVPVPSARLWK